jgi:excisionase family DNA binding protein
MIVLTLDEAAKRASLTRRSIERLLSAGEGPALVMLGKRRRGILDTDLDRWFQNRRVPPPGEASRADSAD